MSALSLVSHGEVPGAAAGGAAPPGAPRLAPLLAAAAQHRPPLAAAPQGSAARLARAALPAAAFGALRSLEGAEKEIDEDIYNILQSSKSISLI